MAPQLKEEAGIDAVDAKHCGILNFHFDDNPQPWEVRQWQSRCTWSRHDAFLLFESWLCPYANPYELVYSKGHLAWSMHLGATAQAFTPSASRRVVYVRVA